MAAAGVRLASVHPTGTLRSVGVQLRSFRERAGLSQEALAERAGIGVATLASIERDQRRRPHLHTLATLADTLGLSSAERAALLESARSHDLQPGVDSSHRVATQQSPRPLPEAHFGNVGSSDTGSAPAHNLPGEIGRAHV